MRRQKYPKLTHDHAEEAAQVYMRMRDSKRLIWRTTDFGASSTNRGYKQTLEALWRLHDNKIVGNTTVGDAGNIWWLRERVIDYGVD